MKCIVSDPLCQSCHEAAWSAITILTGVKRCLRCFSDYYAKKEPDVVIDFER